MATVSTPEGRDLLEPDILADDIADDISVGSPAAVAVAALRAGAFDLIEKPSSAAEVLASIRHAIKSGDTIHPQSDAQRVARARLDRLTERERQVLTRVLAGVANKIIAADLGLSQRTVEQHRASVMRKTETASVPALIRLAFAGNFNKG